MSELISEQISQLSGTYPDVPFAPGVVPEELGENPLFVTLPIGKVGARSRSGRTYSRNIVNSIVEQINQKRPEGRWGHLKDEERATRYDPPAIRWLGAALADDGTAWAKGIPITEQARDHFRLAKAAGARVGTSIYGTPTYSGKELVAVNLESLDIADPERVGVLEAAALPHITAEMQDENEAMTEEKIQELTQERDQLQVRIGEMEQQISVLAEMRTVLGADESADVLAEMRGIIQERDTLREAAAATEIDGLIAEMVPLEKLRPTIKRILGKTGDPEAAKTRIAELLEAEDIKTLAQDIVTAEMGPEAVIAAAKQKQHGNGTVQDTPENRAAARNRTGI